MKITSNLKAGQNVAGMITANQQSTGDFAGVEVNPIYQEAGDKGENPLFND